MKHLILEADCTNTLAHTDMSSVHIALSDQDIDRVKMLAAQVNSLDVKMIQDESIVGLWSSEYDISGYKDQTSGIVNINKAVNALDICSMHIEGNSTSLVVESDHFYFTAIPPHCEGSMLVESDRVPIEDLSSSDSYISPCLLGLS